MKLEGRPLNWINLKFDELDRERVEMDGRETLIERIYRIELNLNIIDVKGLSWKKIKKN